MSKPEPPDDLWEKLAEVESTTGISPVEVLADGWFDRRQYAAKRKISVKLADYRLEKLVSVGLLEVRRACIRVNGRLVQTRVYRIKKDLQS